MLLGDSVGNWRSKSKALKDSCFCHPASRRTSVCRIERPPSVIAMREGVATNGQDWSLRQANRHSRPPRPTSPAVPGSGTPEEDIEELLQPPFIWVWPASVVAVSEKTHPLMVPASTPLPPGPAFADMVKLVPA